jgi:hypothetical protein
MNLRPIRTVLDRAASDGRVVTFWWRDDDAIVATPQLDRLLAIARAMQASVAIAAIPARIEPSLPARIRDEPGSRVLVHGLHHLSHAKPGQKPAEFGDDRPVSALEGDARDGLAQARAVAGALLLPVFVPPWNRLSPALAATLPQLGYAGLSTFGASASYRAGGREHAFGSGGLARIAQCALPRCACVSARPGSGMERGRTNRAPDPSPHVRRAALGA